MAQDPEDPAVQEYYRQQRLRDEASPDAKHIQELAKIYSKLGASAPIPGKGATGSAQDLRAIQAGAGAPAQKKWIGQTSGPLKMSEQDAQQMAQKPTLQDILGTVLMDAALAAHVPEEGLLGKAAKGAAATGDIAAETSTSNIAKMGKAGQNPLDAVTKKIDDLAEQIQGLVKSKTGAKPVVKTATAKSGMPKPGTKAVKANVKGKAVQGPKKQPPQHPDLMSKAREAAAKKTQAVKDALNRKPAARAESPTKKAPVKKTPVKKTPVKKAPRKRPRTRKKNP